MNATGESIELDPAETDAYHRWAVYGEDQYTPKIHAVQAAVRARRVAAGGTDPWCVHCNAEHGSMVEDEQCRTAHAAGGTETQP